MVQSLLLQFPGPLTLYASRSKFFMLFAGSASFVTFGAVMLVQDGSSTMMWFSVLFFALCSVVFAANLLPGAASLTLDADGFQVKQFYGFQVKQFYFVRKSYWKNVTSIDSGYIAPSRTKVLRYNDTQWNGWRLARWETARLGYNAVLPDTYGLSADALAALMVQWRNQALVSAST